MKTVIYLDVLLLVNFLMGYFLLRAAGLLSGTVPGFGRALAGAVLAALSSLVLLAPPLPPAAQTLYQLAAALLIVRCAFCWRGWRSLLRQALWYALLNLLTAGLVVLAIQHWGTRALHTNNLAVYVDLSPLTLLLSVVSVSLCIRLAVLLFGPPEPAAGWSVRLELAGTALTVSGCLDTGFFLRDPLGSGPALMLSWPAVQGRLPPALAACVTACHAGRTPSPPLPPSFRLVPCSTVTGSGVLPAVVAPRVELRRGRECRCTDRVTVVFTPRLLGAGDALFGEALVRQTIKQKKEGCAE